MSSTEEHVRISEADLKPWRKWGPYLSERAWATVREDYSAQGEAWDCFTHDQARMRAYRWGEDGLGGFSDDHQNLCLALALWNERDPILKERLFGLTNTEGNHGEDVKELYHYLDCTPTSSYARMLYRYPQVAYPYAGLLAHNHNRPGPEWELTDELAEEFRAGRYFDIVIEYAKAEPEDILCRITATNRGPDPAPLHLLPQLWYRNYWSWPAPAPERPRMRKVDEVSVVTSDRHPHLGQQWWYAQEERGGTPEWLFTDNDSNAVRLGWGERGPAVRQGRLPCPPDSARERGQGSQSQWTNPQEPVRKWPHTSTGRSRPGKAGRSGFGSLPPGWTHLSPRSGRSSSLRKAEADRFYATLQPRSLGTGRAFWCSARLWPDCSGPANSIATMWRTGCGGIRPPLLHPRSGSRAATGSGASSMPGNVIVMPDAWEYPWFAAWDLAFHCVTLALVDPRLRQEPVAALAAGILHAPQRADPGLRVGVRRCEPARHGLGRPPGLPAGKGRHRLRRSRSSWSASSTSCCSTSPGGSTAWIRKETTSSKGGFLGLDNISLVDRTTLPMGERMEQADGSGLGRCLLCPPDGHGP